MDRDQHVHIGVVSSGSAFKAQTSLFQNILSVIYISDKNNECFISKLLLDNIGI